MAYITNIYCVHEKQRSKCKVCGGGSVCEHHRQRSVCKACGGSQICKHQRVRSQCKTCEGSQICQHQRIRTQCTDCGGSQVKPTYCADCDIETTKQHFKRHLKSPKHLRNTLPINY